MKPSGFNYKILSMKLIEWHAAKTNEHHIWRCMHCVKKTLFYVHILVLCAGNDVLSNEQLHHMFYIVCNNASCAEKDMLVCRNNYF